MASSYCSVIFDLVAGRNIVSPVHIKAPGAEYLFSDSLSSDHLCDKYILELNLDFTAYQWARWMQSKSIFCERIGKMMKVSL